MKIINKQSIIIPVTQASSGKQSANGKLYGSGDIAIIFSNMDTNDQNEWNPVLNDLISTGYMAITYEYPEYQSDQSGILEDVISFVLTLGAKRIILIGASRGGVASIKVAAHNVNNHSIICVIALSTPIEYEGTVFYSGEELSSITIPKLLINSENDDGAKDNLQMFGIFCEPKELQFYNGNAHGTELFDQERELIIKKLQHFIKLSLTIYTKSCSKVYKVNK